MDDYGSWWLNHPVKAFLIYVGCSMVGYGAGVLAAYITSWVWHQGNNVLLGFAEGTTGVYLGFGVGVFIICRINKRNS